MIYSYLKTALRLIIRHKGYSFINIVGLGIGMACCLLIFLKVQHEVSYDKFHNNAIRTYKVRESTSRSDGFARTRTSTGTPLGPMIENEIGAIETVVRTTPWEATVRREEICFRESQILFADPEFFELFTFPLLIGDSTTVLDEPFSVVLTQETARRYFGDEDPIGQTLFMENRFDLTVTGIASAPPINSQFQFDFVASSQSLDLTISDWSSHWDSPTETYLLLGRASVVSDVQASLDRLAEDHPLGKAGTEIKYSLMPLTDIHLEWDGSLKQLYILCTIALFVLVMAVINYVNLASALAMRRVVEFGLRRVVGGTRWQLAGQYIGESMLITLMAALLATGLAELILPFYSDLAGLYLELNLFGNPLLLIGLIVTSCTIGLVAGILPALYLTSVKITAHLKGTAPSPMVRSWVRRFLVVLQFSIAVVMIVGATITRDQLTFLQEKDLGFDRAGLIAIPLGDLSRERKMDIQAVLKPALQSVAGVQTVTVSSSLPGGSRINALTFGVLDGRPLQNLPVIWVDHDYLRTLGVNVAEGRDFSMKHRTDEGGAFVLNRLAFDALGLQTPPGAELVAYADPNGQGAEWYRGPVIGVTDDFYFRHLHFSLQPVVLIVDPRHCNYTLVRLSRGDPTAAITGIKKAFENLFPETPFEYKNLDEEIIGANQAETKAAALSTAACLLALVQAFLGLFGLASFMAQERTREIGIRRVLGASVSAMVRLLTRESALLVGLANVVSWPIAYMLAHWWLREFPYRVEVHFGFFLIAAILTLTIAIVSVGYQAVTAALSNPVDAIRHD